MAEQKDQRGTSSGRGQNALGRQFPHIVWILCDQLRADALGFMGNRHVRTPNLDRLAGRGIIFDQQYTQLSACMASRACMLTGRYPSTIRMSNGSPLLDPRETTLPEILQRAGYRTGMFGKLHITPQLYTYEQLKSDRPISDARIFMKAAHLPEIPDDPVKRNYGFQEVVGFEDLLWGQYAQWLAARDAKLASMLPPRGVMPWEGWEIEFPNTSLWEVGQTIIPPQLHPSSFIAESAIDFFARHHTEAPCFMEVSFVDPHHPWDPPREIAKNYPPEEIPLPRHGDPGNVTWPAALVERSFDFSDVTPHMARTTIAYYYAMIDQIDRAVGRVIDAIAQAGEMDNTLFVFAADHGELLGDYGLWKKGAFHYDCMIRVPTFLSYPARLGGGRRINELTGLIDLPGTILGLLGLPMPYAMQGRDLSAALAAGEPVGRDWVHCEIYFAGGGPYIPCWTLRTPTAKLNYYPTERIGHLFDLTEDPDELNDLYASRSHRRLRDEMTANLLAEIRLQRDPIPKQISTF